ncbi:hypothetical protein S40285_10874 [Stachybotrys chlorohalonatus IBT 40285]|uniref:PiggyBac transposable element-derived protein domain-containing protein n=1 Tax=Stachybotrys chlorohalonatus (strain IBT 40285) TaxID=1283841 RepID=A0A084QY45_STAC4|nr:hypothetical protein S40285_10874 [Stachybotrys chlorohalonata IBT 40285]
MVPELIVKGLKQDGRRNKAIEAAGYLMELQIYKNPRKQDALRTLDASSFNSRASRAQSRGSGQGPETKGRYSRVPDPFNKVNEWSNYMMEVAVRLVEIGSIIGVDEAIIGFKGQSHHKITIKTKPTPIGLKVWVLAIHGYLLRWYFHQPGPKYGPVGIEADLQAILNMPSNRPSNNEPSDEPSLSDEMLDSSSNSSSDDISYSSSSDDSADEGPIEDEPLDKPSEEIKA